MSEENVCTCSGVDKDALVGPQVAKVEQHHVGSDVVDRKGCGLLEAHALRDEEGVAGRHHCHLLPEPKAVQHHHLITHLEEKTQEAAVCHKREIINRHKYGQITKNSYIALYLLYTGLIWKTMENMAF